MIQSSMPQRKLYLLSGNGSMKAWWQYTLPHFQQKEAIPLELPGFGDNPSDEFDSLHKLADALVDMTEAGHEIFAVGINGLVVLHALVKHPEHFKKVTLLAPVGAFLWQRKFVKFMSRKPIRKSIHFLLRNYPKIFKRKFSSQNWTDEQYQMMGEGYRKCRAFQKYFEMVRPYSALYFFEHITTPIELIWGTKDAVLGIEQAAAWDSILARAELTISIKEDWGHYPYIDDPEGFASYMDDQPTGFLAHTKGGRLKLAEWADIPVPRPHIIQNISEYHEIQHQLKERTLGYALRSSRLNEDHIEGSQAGLNTTLLKVPKAEIPSRLVELFADGMEAVVIQPFVEPKVSGVAFVRNMSMEIELVEGHLEELLQGNVQAERIILSKMGGEWEKKMQDESILRKHGMSLQMLEDFLRNCIRAFHYQPSDIEWAWDGKEFILFQIRPDTGYQWHRCLTSANLDEILPKRVSRIMEHIQRKASPYIGRVMGLWDPRILSDNEPFTVPYGDASYINSDLFLSRFRDWGLPSSLYASEIGGSVPKLPFRLGNFLRTIPVFIRMSLQCRREFSYIAAEIQRFEAEILSIISQYSQQSQEKEAALVNWLERYYLFIVQANIVINSSITSSFGDFFGKARTVYGNLNTAGSPHRVKYESDPATKRHSSSPKKLLPFPKWSPFIKLMHRIGMPGMHGKYFEVREWFRDNNMRLFHRFHLEMRGSEWLETHHGVRSKTGTFWQDLGASIAQDFSFVIYPGKAEGVLGKEILVVDALEPGHYEMYKRAKAVISRSGGRLSHGATLLRELKKPSAVIDHFENEYEGHWVRYSDGKVTLLEKKDDML